MYTPYAPLVDRNIWQQSDSGSREGLITQVVIPTQKWRVKYAATEWFAIVLQPSNLSVGDSVNIVGMQSATTLFIEPK
ncbi:MAG: hypothetical protein ACOYME_10125 [Prochlorotrichaceae cyanobacterium]|jgi:hypothetical protein